MTQVLCRCDRLVEVVDNKLVEHESKGDGLRCPDSGRRYVPKRGRSSGPSVEVVAEGPVVCESCGDLAGYGAIVRISDDQGQVLN